MCRLKKTALAVAAENRIYADSAYTAYQIEDDIRQSDDMVELMIQRKRNSKRADELRKIHARIR